MTCGFAKTVVERDDFILNQEPYRHAKILVTDENFGCGSSREGAVYALYDYGIRAIVGPSFGDIFYNNALKNGLVPVKLPAETVDQLRAQLLADPHHPIVVDLEAERVTLPDGSVHVLAIDPFWRECLMKGVDEIELTLGYMPQIREFENRYLAQMRWINR